MDVYSSYQDRYLGQVARVWMGGSFSRQDDRRGAGERQTGSAPEIPDQNPKLRQEQGDVQSPTRLIGRKVLGEEEGPYPTMDIGNSGPVAQSAEHEYATNPRDPHEGVVLFAVRPGRYNPFARLFYVPTTAVHSVSMERIVVDIEGDGIPDEWRRRPEV